MGWFVLRVNGGELRADLLLPGAELRRGVGHAFGILAAEVVLLAEIVREVEQFHAAILEPLDEFPVAAPDGRRGRAALVAVVRVVPEQRALRQVAAFEAGA